MPLPVVLAPVISAAAPWIVRALGRWLVVPLVTVWGHLVKTRLGLFILTAFAWLGINFGTVTLVLEPAIQTLTGLSQELGNGSGGGQYAAVAGAYIGIMQFDRAITMVISAVIIKHSLLKGRLYLFKRGVPGTP
jgi:hypothetical protein